jgi:hypothetical protein
MLNVIMLSVVAPLVKHPYHYNEQKKFLSCFVDILLGSLLLHLPILEQAENSFRRQTL